MGQLSRPLVPDGPVRVFYDRLHDLHLAAGQPSMRDLQRGTRDERRPRGINPTTIHDAFTATKVAQWEVVAAIVRLLGGDVDEFAELWRAARAATSTANANAVTFAADIGATVARGRGQPPRVVSAAAGQIVPRQLPAAARHFAGRSAELAALDELSVEATRGTGARAGHAVVIVAIDGPAGVGKTTLAVHWAHQAAARFPDGQLYVNLRGFDPAESPVTVAEAVRGFLDAFGVPAQRIPVSVTAQAALYRSLLADRRVLVVLDNARDVDQVRPLLPGSRGCLAVVTSRNQLGGLIAAEGAHPVTLGLLSTDDARTLLARRLGAARVAAHPDAADEIIALCARLPLALALVTARAAAHPGFGLDALAVELREAGGGLEAFAAADASSDVRAALSWSLGQLSPTAARLFRLLGLHPGPDVAIPAATSLSGIPCPRVRPALAELAHAHLVTEHMPGRFAFHDLLRAYATELAHATDSGDDRHAALHRALDRALDHYLHTAHRAALLLNPDLLPMTLQPPQPSVTVEDLPDAGSALAWFTAEYAVLLAAVERAAAAGFDGITWQLAATLTTFFDRRGHWQDWVTTLQTALRAARRLSDRAAEARVHRSLAGAYTRLGRYEDTHAHLHEALARYGDLDDRAGQAHAHRDLGWVLGKQGRHTEALGHALQALEGFEAAGNLAGQARALNAVGWYHARLGDHQQSNVYCQRALALHRDLGNRAEEGHAWDTLGYALCRLGQYDEAITHLDRALHLHREAGHRYHEADTLTHLGDTYQAAGAPDAARRAWQQALDIFDELGHPDADAVRPRLSTPGYGAAVPEDEDGPACARLDAAAEHTR